MLAVFKNWDFYRTFRLVAGLAMFGFGVYEVDWPFIILGTMVGWIAITNTGCSPYSNSCEVEPKTKQ